MGDWLWWVPFGTVGGVEAEPLARELERDCPPRLLDVRTALEWRQSHIRGAVNVPILELKARLPELTLEKDRPVVAICLTAHRSVPAVRLLEDAGFESVRQLEGGMVAWWRARLPTESGGRARARIR